MTEDTIPQTLLAVKKAKWREAHQERQVPAVQKMVGMPPRTMTATPEWVAAQDVADWLTARERAHCDAAASVRRCAERRAGRLALKRLLGETFGAEPLSYEIGTDGVAPILSGWEGTPEIVVSLSHSAGLGAASWAWVESERSVGVDAQHIRRAHPGLAARVLALAEQRQTDALGPDTLLLFWALKEAAIKARRRAWGRALNQIVVMLDAPGTARISIAGEEPMAAGYARQGEWWLARATLALPSSPIG